MLEQITHLENFHFDDPVWLATLAAGPTFVAGEFLRHLPHKNPGVDAPMHSDTIALRDISDAAPNRKFSNTTKRLLGLGIVAVSALALLSAHPVTEQSIPDPNAQVVIVEDHSNDMVLTADMELNQLRFDVVSASAKEAVTNAPRTLKIGFINFGGSVDSTTGTPTTDRPAVLSEITKTFSNDPNGKSLTEAFAQAVDAFPKQAQPSHNKIIILSDGIGDDPAKLTQEIQDATKSGISVNAIVPGTKEGSYTSDITRPDPIQPEVFAAAGKNNVQVETKGGAVVDDLTHLLTDAASRKEKHPYHPIGWFAYGSSVVAIAAGLSEGAKRWAISYRNRKAA